FMARKPTGKETPPLTIVEQRQQMVEHGDVFGLLSIWTQSPRGVIDFQEVGDMVRQAVEVRVRTEPTRFAQELFSEMIGLIGLLVLRTHCRVRTLVADEDAQMARRGCWSASKELEDLT